MKQLWAFLSLLWRTAEATPEANSAQTGGVAELEFGPIPDPSG